MSECVGFILVLGLLIDSPELISGLESSCISIHAHSTGMLQMGDARQMSLTFRLMRTVEERQFVKSQ